MSITSRRVLSLLFTGLLSTLFVPVSSPAAEPKLRWHDARELPLEGQGWGDTAQRYDRLPRRAESLVRPPVWSLSRHSAGLSVRFVTNATSIAARWKLRNDRIAMSHMAAAGVSGLDLYVRRDDGWKFLGVGRPEKYPLNEMTLANGLTSVDKEFRLYFPLYNGVEQVEIGIPEDATFAQAAALSGRPIVFYGTSITQGGCASRPGMAYPAILGRRMNVPVINLGFSGNGKTEPEMAQLLAELDPAAFVLDSLPNLEPEQVTERLPGFIATLRRARPETPIVLVENLAYTNSPEVASRAARWQESNERLRAIRRQLEEQGERRLFYIPAENLVGDDREATVDGTHPTDLGFLRMADAMEPYLRRALEEGFISLFDGQTMQGWRPHLSVPKAHVGGKWIVRDRMLVGDQDENQGGGFLITEGQYQDFILRFDLAQDYPTDTGIFVRMGEDGKSHQITLDNRPDGQIGSIYLPWTQSRVLDNPEGFKAFKQGAWNAVEIRVEGEPSRIRLWLNGKLVTDFQHTEQTTKGVAGKGYIGLQVHPKTPGIIHWHAGNTIRYRNIRIKPLPAA